MSAVRTRKVLRSGHVVVRYHHRRYRPDWARVARDAAGVVVGIVGGACFFVLLSLVHGG